MRMSIVESIKRIEKINKRLLVIARLTQEDEMCWEEGHWEADNLLCEVLEILGQSEIVRNYRGVEKWYS